ncbi:hypothetical protein D9611_009592 [Ephemerocybe angulata]|uniref:C2H2-type domain-containing protein n=1 Tax=Ephemerocybe angulata TaxID=980116 RepID=A0A8H5FGH3_9AGAR|nr:hypothetical protein D9611_009592 [Tulosesus angulatus]
MATLPQLTSPTPTHALTSKPPNMRVPLFTLLSCALSLASYVVAHGDHTFEAREAIDAVLAERGLYENDLSVRELLTDVSTRELLDALSDRLEARGFICHFPGCEGIIFPSTQALSAHRRRAHTQPIPTPKPKPRPYQ